MVHTGDRNVSRRRGLEPRTRRGWEQRIAELRLETVFPADRQEEVVAALREAHPYEEPAFDVYALL